VVEVLEEVAAAKDTLRGMRIVKEPPMMRHFTAAFERL
jgi:tryptophanase